MALHPKTWKYGRMTKRLLMSLPEGAVINSDVIWECQDADGTRYDVPIMTEFVAPMAEREAQWQRMKRKHCEGRTFCVFRNKADFLECFYAAKFKVELRLPKGWDGNDPHRA